MKIIILFLSAAILTFASYAQDLSKVLFDHSNTNYVKEIDHFNNKIYVLGKEDKADDKSTYCNSLTCLDYNLNQLYKLSFKNEKFSDLTVDHKGNICIVGFNENQSIFVKIKETLKTKKNTFDAFEKFTNIESFQKGYVIVTSKGHSDNELTSLIYLDSKGKVVWETESFLTAGNISLSVSDDNIYLLIQRPSPNNDEAISNDLLCFNSLGEKEWEILVIKKDKENGSDSKLYMFTKCISGVYLVNRSKISSSNESLTLMYVNDNGEKTVKFEKELIKLKEEKDTNFEDFALIPRVHYKINDTECLNIVIKLNSQKEPYCRGLLTDFEMFCFTEDEDYLIVAGKKGNNWVIRKFEK